MIERRLAVFLFGFVALLSAQTMEKVHFVRASGEATVKAKPDEAQITIGVSTHAATAAEAASRNANETSHVLKAVEGSLGAGGQVKTSGYSLAPQYDYSNGHAPKLTGYEASNTVVITVDELSALPKVIDAATASGANNVNGISFTLRDDEAVRAEVLAKAAVRARANAEAIAKALDVRVVAVLQAEPGELPVIQPRPLMRAMAAPAGMQAATPIEAGDLDIHATVTVTLEVH